jgi:hypothetical protein
MPASVVAEALGYHQVTTATLAFGPSGMGSWSTLGRVRTVGSSWLRSWCVVMK